MIKLKITVIILIAFSVTVFTLLATRISIINHSLYYDYISSKVKKIDKKDLGKKLVIFPLVENKAISLPKKPDKTTKKIISQKERIIFRRKRKRFFKKYSKKSYYKKI